MRKSKLEFILEQGYAASDEKMYGELMLQPRVVAAVVIAGVITQRPWLFLALGVALWGSVMTPAPAPRRFAAGLGGSGALVTGAVMASGLTIVAWVLEAMIVASLVSVLVRRVCLPAALYHRLASARAGRDGAAAAAKAHEQSAGSDVAAHAPLR
jgi:hypothetical protein